MQDKTSWAGLLSGFFILASSESSQRKHLWVVVYVSEPLLKLRLNWFDLDDQPGLKK